MLWSKRLVLILKWSDKFVILNGVRDELCHCCREWYPVHQWWLILWVIWVMGDPIRTEKPIINVKYDVSSVAAGHVTRISWELSYSWLGCMLGYQESNYSFELLYLFYWATKDPSSIQYKQTPGSSTLSASNQWYGQIGSLEVFHCLVNCELKCSVR